MNRFSETDSNRCVDVRHNNDADCRSMSTADTHSTHTHDLGPLAAAVSVRHRLDAVLKIERYHNLQRKVQM